MDLLLVDDEHTNIREMALNGVMCLCDPLSTHLTVCMYGAIASADGSVINCGDFVAYHSNEARVKFNNSHIIATCVLTLLSYT